ncbi:MAG TPA: hypothetical protein VFB74_30700 [Kribbellaceae bacterium]|nr:hypothetical protein [Kribbellaceae bacterium]
MSGEQDEVSLREYVEAMFAERDKAIQAALLAQEKAVEAALSSAEKAITKADVAAEKRFDSVNEFRRTLSDQTATFITRTEYTARHETLTQRVDNVEKVLDRNSGKAAGINVSTGILFAGLGALGAVIGIVVIIANMLTGA